MDDPGPPLVDWAPPSPPLPLSRRQLVIRAALAVTFVTVAGAIAVNQLHLTTFVIADRTWSPTARVEFHGDTWEGNVVVVGSTVYLLTREDIDGFWGNLYLHRSDDGGLTWTDPQRVTSGDIDAARHSLTLASDGTLWAAWSQRGPAPETQRLLLSHSDDGGLTWDAATRVTSPDIRTVGIPSLLMTDEVHLVAFTDGSSGDVNVQLLDAHGVASGDRRKISATSRRLYSDSTFLDAGLALAGDGGRVALAFDDGTFLHLAVGSAEGELTDQVAAIGGTGAAPRLVATTDGFDGLFAVSAENGLGRLDRQVSADAGARWDASHWSGPPVFGASLSRAESGGFGAWATCSSSRCTKSKIWLTDLDRGFDQPTSVVVGATSGPVAIEPTGGGILIAWVEQGSSGKATDRTVLVTTGPKP